MFFKHLSGRMAEMKKNELAGNLISFIPGMFVILLLVFAGLFFVNTYAEETVKASFSAVVKDEEGNASKGAKIQLFVWENSKWVESALAKTDIDGIAVFEKDIQTNKCYKFVELKSGSAGRLPNESERVRFAYVDSSGMVRYSKTFFEESSSLGDNPTAWPIPIINK